MNMIDLWHYRSVHLQVNYFMTNDYRYNCYSSSRYTCIPVLIATMKLDLSLRKLNIMCYSLCHYFKQTLSQNVLKNLIQPDLVDLVFLLNSKTVFALT